MCEAESTELYLQVCLCFTWKMTGKRVCLFFYYSFLFIYIHNCLKKDLNNNLCLHGSFSLDKSNFISLFKRNNVLTLFHVSSTVPRTLVRMEGGKL